ncbi:MAG: flagellin, partial [Desulfovibrio sp.]|nr:flagellin [Desulfovibrio sp.]
MSLYVKHNLMAIDVANSLNQHYAELSASTKRLATGLRINSSADDAAGLAIRELQRADISALHQGMRNVNDAISLLQTADAALAIIDEKLIRMKELAEQASTGTYDSVQRLMLDSEFQQMAKEIDRIALSTDFNGIHILNGDLETHHEGSNLKSVGALKVHFGTANDSAEDYYYIQIPRATVGSLFPKNFTYLAEPQATAPEFVDWSQQATVDENGKYTFEVTNKIASTWAAGIDAYV